jgi:hypothetical protein
MQDGFSYLFKVEEDRIEAEEHESHGSSEPAPGFVVERIRIKPGANFEPTIRLVKLMDRVGCCKDEGVDAGQRGQSGHITDCIVEPHCVDEVAQHRRINHTCNTGTASNVAYCEPSSLGKPCCGDCGMVSGSSTA